MNRKPEKSDESIRFFRILRSDSKLPPSNDVRVQKIKPKVVFHQKRLCNSRKHDKIHLDNHLAYVGGASNQQFASYWVITTFSCEKV